MSKATQQPAGQEGHREQSSHHLSSRAALERGLSSGGCVLCAAIAWFEWKSIHSFLYEGMMFPHVRAQFLKGGGFCARHFEIARHIEKESWQAGGIGMAILCEDLLEIARREIERTAAEHSRMGGQRPDHHAFRPGDPCMFCESNSEKEHALVEVLEGVHEEPMFQAALENSGLCLWHGQLLLASWKGKAARSWLAASLQRRIEELTSDLKELIRKHDYRHRGEIPGREQDSVNRARELILGTRL